MKFNSFRVFNYRNIHDSGLIDVNQITAFVGQNEAGKSNLFDALYRVNPFDQQAKYNIDEDWPVDLWSEKGKNKLAKVCDAYFELNSAEIESLFTTAEKSVEVEEGEEPAPPAKRPGTLTLLGTGYYNFAPTFSVPEDVKGVLDSKLINAWAKLHVPKLVYIDDYQLSGTQMELNALQERKATVPWDDLTPDEQSMSIVLDLAKIDIDDFQSKGESADGRTIRSFDKRSASAYLSKQFQSLWRQKDVKFDIEIDATTLNIFVEDEGIGMPVRLHRRSTGFRWYVGFAWKFTHASDGQFKNCILLLEEPGIHLHYSAQNDLLKVFERLKDTNTVLYTTHLASMVDLGHPERIRLVESTDKHATVKTGVVSSQKAPMAVIEMSLGLTGEMSGLLGNRKTLIVEGGDDALILQKLSAVMRASGKASLSDSIYLWPAHSASKTPMYAAFAIGQKWDSGVLLDTDQAGQNAKDKIIELCLPEVAEGESKDFRVFMIAQAAGIKNTDAAIEELFPEEFYLDLVNTAYGLGIKPEELPVDGSDMITKRVESVLINKHSRSGLDKRLVLAEMLKRFDAWHEAKDMPKGTATKACKLFETINQHFGEDSGQKSLDQKAKKADT